MPALWQRIFLGCDSMTAADAGPRQPCPHVNTMGHEWASRCQDCGEVWAHALPPGYTVTIPAPKGTCDVHEGLHGIYPNCVNYRLAAPPVPQEAAPDREIYPMPTLQAVLTNACQLLDSIKMEWEPEGCWSNWDQQVREGMTRELRKTYTEPEAQSAMPSEEIAQLPATAPDGAMRVAREITTRWQKWQVAYAGNFAGCDTHGGPVPPTEREVAALIREAGSERERGLLLLAGRLCESQSPEWGDVDGATIEEWLLEAGLFKQIDVTEPCDHENCQCAEYGFPTKCNRCTELGKRAVTEASRLLGGEA